MLISIALDDLNFFLMRELGQDVFIDCDLLNKDFLIAGGENDNSIKILDLNKGSIIKTLMEHNNFVINLRIINHKKYGKCLLSQGFSDDQIKLWKKNIFAKRTI